MLFPLLGATTLLGAVTGFIELSKGAFFKTLGGQIVQGMLSIVCFIFVGCGSCFLALRVENRPA